jgi:hypothetical protein
MNKEQGYKEALEEIVAWLEPNPISHMKKMGFDCEGCLWEIEEAYRIAVRALNGKFSSDEWKDAVKGKFDPDTVIEVSSHFEEHQESKNG